MHPNTHTPPIVIYHSHHLHQGTTLVWIPAHLEILQEYKLHTRQSFVTSILYPVSPPPPAISIAIKLDRTQTRTKKTYNYVMYHCFC